MDFSESHFKPPSKQWVINEYFWMWIFSLKLRIKYQWKIFMPNEKKQSLHIKRNYGVERFFLWKVSSVQFVSVAHSCPTLCNPMNCSTPGLPVHHQLPEFTQTYVHWVSDAIQPSHPLSFSSPSSFCLTQNQDIFQWAGSLHQVA